MAGQARSGAAKVPASRTATTGSRAPALVAGHAKMLKSMALGAGLALEDAVAEFNEIFAALGRTGTGR